MARVCVFTFVPPPFYPPFLPPVVDTTGPLWGEGGTRLPPMRRLSALTLLRDRPGQVGARFGIVGLNSQGLLEMFGRLGRLALPTKHHAPIVLSLGIVRLDAQGLLEMFDRLGRLAL